VALVAVAYRQAVGPLTLVFNDRHYNLQLLGYLFSGNAIAVCLFQLPLSYYTRRLPVWIPLSLSALLTGGAYILLLAGTSLPLLIANFALWTVGDIIIGPLTMVVAMMMSTPQTAGSYQGALSVARSTGLAVGPSLGVFAYSVQASLPWYGAGVCGLIAAAIFAGFLRYLPAASSHGPRAGCR